MDWISRIFGYFMRVLLPARFRRSALEYKVTKSIEQLSDRMSRPEETLAKAADKTVSQIEKRQTGKDKDDPAAAAAGGAAAAATGAAPAAPSKVAPALNLQPEPARWTWAGLFLWVFHFLVLGAILYGLWYLNRWLGVEKLLRSDFPQLHPYWLPLLFLILYAIWWMGLWLWELTGPDAVGWEYPDVNVAWGQALDALSQAGIDLQSTPLFLVLGESEAPEAVLFESSGLALRVRQAPRSLEAPLHVYATADAIYVTCPGASLLAQQAEALSQQHPPTEPGMEQRPSGDTPEPAPTTAGGPEGEEESDPWSEEERRVVGLLTAVEQSEKTRTRPGTTLMRNRGAVQDLTRRLQHLCRLIQRDRRPYCPLNGILVLLPYAAAGEEIDASQTATACRYDLLVIQEILQVRCPIEVVVTDLERAPGFREVLRRLPAGQPLRRLGQPFPLLPDIDEVDTPGMVQQGLGWFTGAFVPALVYNLFRLETPATPRSAGLSAEEAQASNQRLYQFLEDLRQRRQRLGRLLVRSLLLEMPSFYFSGVHFAGRTRGGYALLPGVFDRVSQNQNYVAWTRAALAADGRQRGWASFLLLLVMVLILGAPVLTWLFWPF